MNQSMVEQVALFLMECGEMMTAKDMYEAGFRFADEGGTTTRRIGNVMSKLDDSLLYLVEKSYRVENKRRWLGLRVLGIKPPVPRAERVSDQVERALWQQLRTRRNGQCVEVMT